MQLIWRAEPFCLGAPRVKGIPERRSSCDGQPSFSTRYEPRRSYGPAPATTASLTSIQWNTFCIT